MKSSSTTTMTASTPLSSSSSFFNNNSNNHNYKMNTRNNTKRHKVGLLSVFLVGSVLGGLSLYVFVYTLQVYLQQESISFHGERKSTNDATLVKSLAELMNASGTDKYSSHHYEHYYNRWISHLRNEPIKLLEIGAEQGRSLSVWSDYFAQSQLIAGLAYSYYSENVEETVADKRHVVIFRGDQSKNETMQVLQIHGPWDVIIDDGSHYPAHMIYSLFALWGSVKLGGFYIIEDLETNYWKPGSVLYDYNFTDTGISKGPYSNAVSKLKQLIDVLNRYPLGVPEELSVMPGDNTVCEMNFGMNIMMLRKCNAQELSIRPAVKERPIDELEMQEWIQDARRSNPKGFDY